MEIAQPIGLKAKRQKRIEELKGYKSLANRLLADNVALQKKPKPDWIHETTIENIKALKNIINTINLDLSQRQVDEFCEEPEDLGLRLSIALSQINPLSFFGQISSYTVPGSILYDINWLTDFTIGEKMEIAFGKRHPGDLPISLDNLSKSIENELLPSLNKNFPEQADLVLQAISLAKNNSLVACNILIMTAIESIVRQFCKSLSVAQNLATDLAESDKLIGSRQSMESVIRGIEWKRDIELETIDLTIRFDYVNEPEVSEAKEVINKAIVANKKIRMITKRMVDKLQAAVINQDESEAVREEQLKMVERMKVCAKDLIDIRNHKSSVSLKTFLHFLVRRFKEDRNTLIHGGFSGFGTKWKTYVYLSALRKLFEVTEMYNLKYSL